MKFTREDVLAFATRKHAGQKRKDGKDYITHPIAVAEISTRLVEEYYNKYNKDPYTEWLLEMIEIAWVVSILHDTLEDTDTTYEELVEHFGVVVTNYVNVLTKTDGVTYFDFIVSIVDPIAILVKLADLEHNMSDLNEGSLKDKYRFAQAYLQDQLRVD